jgi:hypothetical protein
LLDFGLDLQALKFLLSISRVRFGS